jgi:para-nitrobenzyl esterase
VIVWLHGGAFVGGSSALYPLEHMAKSGDVVVVSMNYRLGVFGFTAHPAFDAGHNGGYGLEDQRAALRWVKSNIAAFGGDPANVTLAGESAGAASVCMHILAPDETAGLFQKAIVQSAGCVTPLPSVADGNKIGQQIAAGVGCGEDAGALACLRGKSVAELLASAAKVSGSSIVTFLPVIGARTVPLPGAQAIPAGKFVKVPMLMGGTRDELRLYVAYAAQAGQTVTAANYADQLKQVYGDKADAVLKQYPVGAASSPPAGLGSLWSDFRPDVGINNCIYLQTSKLIRKSVPVYAFVFGDAAAPAVTPDPGFEMGAVHSSELIYQFPHFDNTQKLAGPALAPASQKLADKMMAYWTSFAKTGIPRAPNAPIWSRFGSDSMVMNLDPKALGLFNAAAAHRCKFWKTMYPKILTE